MAGFGLRKNMGFEWNGAAFLIDRLHQNGDVILECVKDGVISVVPREQLLAEYRAGKIAATPAMRSSEWPKEKVFSRPLDELSADVQHEAARRRHYLQIILDEGQPVFTKSYLTPLILRAASEIGDSNPPGIVSIYRWYRRYQQSDDTRALIPRFDRRGSRLLKQEARILQLASESIDEAFKESPQSTVPSIYTKLIGKIDAENRLLLPSDRIKPPCLRTVYRMLSRVEAYDIAVLKEGKSAADKRFRLVKEGVTTNQILERVEIDHTPLDLFLIDQRSGLPLGRPTLTVAIDHFSRMILGFHLSFGNPSTAAVMGVLRHAILPKLSTIEVLPDLKIEHPWICYGRPDVIVVDNGLEFHGRDLDSVAYDLGIRIQYCPKHQPRFKGVVERFLKTINYSFAHQLPGTSFARWHKRGDYDPSANAILTLAEFHHIFQKWAMDVYAQTIHRGMSETPWARWQEGMMRREPELPESVNALKQRIGHIQERALRQDGIVLLGIRYNGDSLAPILRAYGSGTKVRVLYDDEDLGDIQVWGPDDTEPVCVLALNQSYARGLTAFQNELIRTVVREKGESQQDQAALQRAKLAINNVVEKLMGSRKQRDRRLAGKMLGLSSSKSISLWKTSSTREESKFPAEDASPELTDQPAPTTSPGVDTPMPVAYSFFRPKQNNIDGGSR